MVFYALKDLRVHRRENCRLKDEGRPARSGPSN
jgi:hypothetical protein